MLAQVVTDWVRLRVFLFLDYWFQRGTIKLINYEIILVYIKKYSNFLEKKK